MLIGIEWMERECSIFVVKMMTFSMISTKALFKSHTWCYNTLCQLWRQCWKPHETQQFSVQEVYSNFIKCQFHSLKLKWFERFDFEVHWLPSYKVKICQLNAFHFKWIRSTFKSVAVNRCINCHLYERRCRTLYLKYTSAEQFFECNTQYNWYRTVASTFVTWTFVH